MASLQQLLQSGGFGGQGQQAPAGDAPAIDTAEMVHISSLALLKVRAAGAHTQAPWRRSCEELRRSRAQGVRGVGSQMLKHGARRPQR